MAGSAVTYEERLQVRRQAVEVMRRSGFDVLVREDLAEQLGVTPRALRRWELRARKGEAVYRRRGPKAEDVLREDRQSLISAMIRLGPHAGVPALRGVFGHLPYRFIGRMKRRLARVIKRRYRWYRRRLKWLRAAAVWAIDFTKPQTRLWRNNNRLFLVRDLGSGAQLAAVACRGERARVACAVLLALIGLYGVPLVLKKDNGGALRSKRVAALLKAYRIAPLDSPPYTPQYNGACERSGGHFKKCVDHIALMEGHAERWLPQDLDEALFVANTTARPFGATGPTPAEALEARRPITRMERSAFLHSLHAALCSALEIFKEENGTMPTCLWSAPDSCPGGMRVPESSYGQAVCSSGARADCLPVAANSVGFA